MANLYEATIGPIRIPYPEMESGDRRRLEEFIEKTLADGFMPEWGDKIVAPPGVHYGGSCEEAEEDVDLLKWILGQRRALIRSLIAKLRG